MRLAEVIEARQHAVPQPSWAAIMTKAFALAAREHPQMRQAFLEFPWGHIGEFEYQVGTVVITRRVGNEDIVFFARLPEPEKRSLRELDDLIRFHQQVPLDKCGATRIVLSHCAAAAFAKPIFVVAGVRVLPRERVRLFGTFTVSTTAPFGTKSLVVPTVGSPVEHFGAINEAGEMPVNLVIDHRIMDGAVVGFTLMEMEQVLRYEIRDELLAMAPSPGNAPDSSAGQGCSISTEKLNV